MNPTYPSNLTYYIPSHEIHSDYKAVYLNYLLGKKLTEYNADLIGERIDHANEKLINAFQRELSFIDQRLTAIHQEQINGNVLLKNVGELLRLPDSEKQRQLHIERGIKFSNQALKNVDIAIDAENELTAALKYVPQDWFVLQQLGILHLYHEKVLDIPKAKEYLLASAKYSEADSESNGNNFINNLFRKNLSSPIENDFTKAGLVDFIREVYLNAAFASYILSQYQDAVDIAKKALNVDPNNSKANFFVSKYLTRVDCIEESRKYLIKSINKASYLCFAVYNDKDFLSIPDVIDICNSQLNKFYQDFDLIQSRISEYEEFVFNNEIHEMMSGFEMRDDIFKCYRIMELPLVYKECQENEATDNNEYETIFDHLIIDCAHFVVERQSGSVSNLQRHFNIDYSRATSMMRQFEEMGIVGPNEGSDKREVYFKTDAELQQFLNSLFDEHFISPLEGYFVKDLIFKWEEIYARCNERKTINAKKQRRIEEKSSRIIPPKIPEQKKEGCFIATAVLGDYDHHIVLDLRFFRDNYLAKKPFGIKFVDWYYLHGPKAAKVIAKRAIYRVVTLWLLVKPLHFIVRNTVVKKGNLNS